jgi:hypothetical protein
MDMSSWEYVDALDEAGWISDENLRVIEDYKRSLQLGLAYIEDRKRMEEDVRKMDKRRLVEKRTRKGRN